MKVADIDENGTIDETEFSNFMIQLYDEITPEKAKVVFDQNDENGCGYLNTE